MHHFFRKSITVLCIVSLCFLAAAEEQEHSIEETFVLTSTVEELIQRYYINKLSSEQIYESALAYLKESLAEKKMTSKVLDLDIPDGSERAESKKFFQREYRELAKEHPELVKDNWMNDIVLDGLTKATEDEYTDYLNPTEFRRMTESMSGGNFGGIGIFIEADKKTKELTVVEPIPGTPAEKSGVQAKDIIKKIDGKSTKGVTLEGSQSLLRGPVGSEVILSVKREGVDKLIDIPIIRDTIVVSSVDSEVIEHEDHKLGYIRLRVFGENSGVEVEKALQDVFDNGAEGVILDLRNNGGGYITSAVNVVSRFVESGQLVVSVQARSQSDKRYFSRPNLRTAFPMVLLINEYSASASEITSAALKDYERAVLVGTTSFGKGSVQKILTLQDKSAVKITIAHYLTPEGKDINKIGVDPDIEIVSKSVEFNSEDDDQYQEGLKQIVRLIEGSSYKGSFDKPKAWFESKK